MRHYLLTGATGTVGSAFLNKISQRKEQVTLILRGETKKVAQERLKNLISFLEIKPAAAANIDVIQGDLYQPGLGISKKDYSYIKKNCTHFVHCAGNVYMNLPIEKARHQTLTMTRGMLELFEASSNGKKMEYVSTVGVSGHTEGDMPEEWIQHERAFRNSYETAKAEAEEIVHAKIDAGMPITVHRPSMVIGDSKTGKAVSFQVFYYLCEFLSGSRTKGFVPQVGDMKLDIIPSDFVASILYWSSKKAKLPTPILHACSGKIGAIPLKALITQVHTFFSNHGRHMAPVRMLPVPLYKLLLEGAKLFLPEKERRALGALPFFFNYLKDDQTFSNTRTLELLKKDKIMLPRVDDYLENVLGYYLENKKRRSH